MTRSSAARDWLVPGLQLATLALVAAMFLRQPRPSDPDSEDGGGGAMAELADEISDARFDMEKQVRRLESLYAKLEQQAAAGPAAAAAYDPDAALDKLDPDELLGRWKHVCDVLDRYRSDPLQREPIEQERGRIEAELRKRTDQAVDAIDRTLRTIDNTWLQTRLLSHVVQPIATDRAYDFARSVFADTSLVAGVRLYAATVAFAREADRDAITLQLIGLLENPDPSFDRPEEILIFFKNTPDSRAAPAICKIARDPTADRTVRGFAVEALGAYRSPPEVIDTLKGLVESADAGNLRIEAARSLFQALGKECVEFLQHVRDTRAADDPQLRAFIDNALGA